VKIERRGEFWKIRMNWKWRRLDDDDGAFGVLNTMSRNDPYGGSFLLILVRLNFSSTLL
jgi:hypothetical protein